MPALRSIRRDIDDRSTVVEQSEAQSAGTRVFSTINRFIWLLIGILEALLMFRFVLKLLGANASEFSNLVYSLTEPFVTPFYGVFPSPTSEGLILETATLMAMLVLAIVGAAISALLEVFAPGRID